jgi:uncharacterized protein YjbJ (UPF0337 family)
MDKQRVKGAIDQAVGSTKRHFGNLTGDTETQVGGAVQEVKGKVETAVGKFKDGVRDANNNAEANRNHPEVVVVEERKRR